MLEQPAPGTMLVPAVRSSDTRSSIWYLVTPSVSVKRREAKALVGDALGGAVKVRTPPMTVAVELAAVVLKLRIVAQVALASLVSCPHARKW